MRLTEEIISMTEFVLKNNYLEFNEKVSRKILGTDTRPKFVPPYAWIFIDEMETSFFKTKQSQPFAWLSYTDHKFFIWTHGEEQLNLFLKDLNNFHLNLTFTHGKSQNSVDF